MLLCRWRSGLKSEASQNATPPEDFEIPFKITPTGFLVEGPNWGATGLEEAVVVQGKAGRLDVSALVDR
eukprot:11190814-Lingulodinium_polyedra.AAC.1